MLTGEAFIASPSAASSSTDTAPFTAFPSEFQTVIRDAVLAKVLLNHNAPGAQEVWQRVEEQVKSLLNVYEDHGYAEESVTRESRDVYGDVADMGDSTRLGGGM
jgi:hypothetical protein